MRRDLPSSSSEDSSDSSRSSSFTSTMCKQSTLTMAFIDHELVELSPVHTVVKYQLEAVLMDEIEGSLLSIGSIRRRE